MHAISLYYQRSLGIVTFQIDNGVPGFRGLTTATGSTCLPIIHRETISRTQGDSKVSRDAVCITNCNEPMSNLACVRKLYDVVFMLLSTCG